VAEQAELTPEALANLKENAEARKKESKFIRLEPGERRVFVFDPEKIRRVPSRFDSEKTTVEYKVIDPNIDMQERTYGVTVNQSGLIDKLLAQGITNILAEKDSQGRFTKFTAA
jgi:hypothetical protein